MTEKEKVVVSNKGLARAEFNFWVVRYIDKFYDGLEQKKIVGNNEITNSIPKNLKYIQNLMIDIHKISLEF